MASGTGWGITLGIIYLVLLVVFAVLSFRKGHWVLGDLCKTWLLVNPQVLLPGSNGSSRHASPNTRQRLLQPIERRFPRHTFPSRRSRCDSSVCQDWTKSNSANLNAA